ncbi:MAG: M20/M25/M40 family metallo-hydrolase, partial [Thermoanaerobaculia bacterium]
MTIENDPVFGRPGRAIRRLALLAALTVAVGVPLPAAAGPGLARASAERMAARIEHLSLYGRNADGGVDRVAYSPADVAAREYIAGLMEDAGLAVRVDAAGNLIGRREGSHPELPVIMFGSHIDSVPGGGNYDGDVGVIGALEVIELLRQAGITTRHPLEVISFTDEEGGLIGSLALTGKLKESTLDVVSHSGKTIGDGLRLVGGDPDNLEAARRRPGELAAFVELHIEQG